MGHSTCQVTKWIWKFYLLQPSAPPHSCMQMLCLVQAMAIATNSWEKCLSSKRMYLPCYAGKFPGKTRQSNHYHCQPNTQWATFPCRSVAWTQNKLSPPPPKKRSSATPKRKGRNMLTVTVVSSSKTAPRLSPQFETSSPWHHHTGCDWWALTVLPWTQGGRL